MRTHRAVRAAFERASPQYERAAVLQSRIAAELLDRLEFFRLRPAVVLDLGAGTGLHSRTLKARYRGALVIALDLSAGMLREARRHQQILRRFERICGDAARLPFATGSVDVVFSNLMLQWCMPPDEVLAEIGRVLKPGGLLSFATFGPDTLKELRAAWARVDDHPHVNAFPDMHDLGQALSRVGFREPVLDVERIRLTYPDAMAIMRELKKIGAQHVAGRTPGLTGRGRIDLLQRAYEEQGQAGELPVSYEIIYGAAWGSGPQDPREPPQTPTETKIPLSALRRRRS